jgi:predicted TIM-barrel fold metal-dependent hydrolase
MAITETQAIDVHAHYGIYRQEGKAMLEKFMSGDPELVVRRAHLSRTRLTIVSPLLGLLPRLGADPVAGNAQAAKVVTETEGLLQWVVVDPLKPQTYQQARAMLKLPKCAGIKIHPEEHGWKIREHGEAIFKFAAENQAPLISHSGEENSLPADFLPFVNNFPSVSVILSHLGCGWDGDSSHQVRAIQSSKQGNLFTDTSSASSLTSGLIEWAVKEVGAEKILFGTDTPLYFAPMQRARIDYADISDREKRLILCENAEKILNLGPSRP